MSVPLAGVAWAAPSSGPGSGSGSKVNSVGQGGIPKKAGAFFDAASAANPSAPPANPNGTGNPVPLGPVLKTVKEAVPGVSTPVAVGTFTNKFNQEYFGITTSFGATAPGLAVKTFTPGCTSGHIATDPAVNNGGPICH